MHLATSNTKQKHQQTSTKNQHAQQTTSFRIIPHHVKSAGVRRQNPPTKE